MINNNWCFYTKGTKDNIAVITECAKGREVAILHLNRKQDGDNLSLILNSPRLLAASVELVVFLRKIAPLIPIDLVEEHYDTLSKASQLIIEIMNKPIDNANKIT